MNDQSILRHPAVLRELERETEAMGFRLASQPRTGALLRTLAASKPSGTLLELGTGTGIGTAWLLDGMSSQAQLTSVDGDPSVMAVARRYLESDARVAFYAEDVAVLPGRLPEDGFDLIFADAWAGKYTHLDEALRLLRLGGWYVVDDLLPQTGWSAVHEQRAERLIAELQGRRDLVLTEMAWSTGIIVAVKTRVMQHARGAPEG